MPAILIAGFNRGEVTPFLAARADLDFYGRSCASMRNFIPLAQGPATRRPGTQHIAGAKNNTATILIPFEFSTVQAYVIEAGNGYFRFYRNGGIIEASPGVPYEIASPYSAADLPRLRWAQSADVLFLAHPGHAPRRLQRTGHTSWSLVLAGWLDGVDGPTFGPFLPGRTDLTVTPSATTGSITLTASAALFSANDVGRTIRLQYATVWGVAQITGFTSSTLVSAGVMSGFPVANPSDEFALGAWSIDRGWPSAVTFYQGRLWYGGSPAQPQTIWGSNTGDYRAFIGGSLADDAVQFTLDDDTMNAIRWMKGARLMLIGTAGGEFALGSGGNDAAVTSTNVQVRRQTSTCSAEVQAEVVGSAVLFVQRGGRRVHELTFALDIDGYLAPDISVTGEHLLRGGVICQAWQQEPWRTLWCVTTDGALVGATLMREQDVVAWHPQPLGGVEVKVLSAAVIPSATVGEELWLLVERRIGGSLVRYVERMAPDFRAADTGVGLVNARFSDSHLTYSGAPANVISGLTHLAGQTVQVLADGATHPDLVVSNAGQVTLNRAASVVHVGLRCDARLETLDLGPNLPGDAGYTRQRRVHEVGVLLHESLGCQLGWRDTLTGTDVLETMQFRRPNDRMDQPPPLFSGGRAVPLPQRWEKECRIVVASDQPLPLTVLGLVPRVTVEG